LIIYYKDQIFFINKINYFKIIFKYFILLLKLNIVNSFIIGDWGLGIGDWGLGIGPIPQSPIPNPQFDKWIY